MADTNNHRIQVFALTGEFRCQFGVPGKDEGQLWYPRKVRLTFFLDFVLLTIHMMTLFATLDNSMRIRSTTKTFV